jgi:hypothetical protein
VRELAIHFTRFVWRALQEDWQKWDHLVIPNWVPLGKYPTFGDLKSTLLWSAGSPVLLYTIMAAFFEAFTKIIHARMAEPATLIDPSSAAFVYHLTAV